MGTEWVKKGENSFEGKDRASGAVKYQASAADLCFGSNAELRALAERYAQCDSKDMFIKDFVKAWNKVMELDISIL
jgi:catalase-peroxidase